MYIIVRTSSFLAFFTLFLDIGFSQHFPCFAILGDMHPVQPSSFFKVVIRFYSTGLLLDSLSLVPTYVNFVMDLIFLFLILGFLVSR